MYAIVKTGGKQYRVKAGDIIRIEKLDADVDASVEFKVMMLASDTGETTVGLPFIEGASVTGTVVDQSRDKKVKIIKFKRRKHQMKRQGHRQYVTAVKINEIKTA